jgi:hypothetical protein
MKATQKDLAATLADIARKAKGVDSAANGMFVSLKASNAKTLDQFNALIRAAYEKNRWSRHTGRPVAGSKEKPAPDAVKLYVSSFRAAYRMGLDVLSFDTVCAMRTAVRESRSSHDNGPERPPELAGIHISAEHRLTGAIWHDAVVLHQHLAGDEKAEFEREVRRLLMRFTKKAPPELVAA